MTTTRNLIFAGAAGAVLGAAALFAVTSLAPQHMNVALPGGGTADIRYGGAAPKVAIYPNALNHAIRPASFEMHGPLPQGAGLGLPAAFLSVPAGTCVREVRIIQEGAQAPRVQTRVTGNCALAAPKTRSGV